VTTSFRVKQALIKCSAWRNSTGHDLNYFNEKNEMYDMLMYNIKRFKFSGCPD